MISQEVFLEAEASYSTGLAGGFFTLKITKIKLLQPLKFNGYSSFVTRFLSYKPHKGSVLCQWNGERDHIQYLFYFISRSLLA